MQLRNDNRPRITRSANGPDGYYSLGYHQIMHIVATYKSNLSQIFFLSKLASKHELIVNTILLCFAFFECSIGERQASCLRF